MTDGEIDQSLNIAQAWTILSQAVTRSDSEAAVDIRKCGDKPNAAPGTVDTLVVLKQPCTKIHIT